ncbi:MAG: hypothetical protein QXO51_06770 [Halobacteria archaeon]
MDRRTPLWVAGSLLVGLLVGLGAGLAVKPPPLPAPPGTAAPGDPSTTTKAAEFRAAFRTLFLEHTLWIHGTIVSGLEGNWARFGVAAAKLDENRAGFGKLIEAHYGPGARDEFFVHWQDHIQFLYDYVNATRTNDTAAKERAVRGLLKYVEGFSDFLNRLNPTLPRAVNAAVTTAHIAHLQKVAESAARGDPQVLAEDLEAAFRHAGSMGDALAAAVVSQFPERF